MGFVGAVKDGGDGDVDEEDDCFPGDDNGCCCASTNLLFAGVVRVDTPGDSTPWPTPSPSIVSLTLSSQSRSPSLSFTIKLKKAI